MKNIIVASTFSILAFLFIGLQFSFAASTPTKPVVWWNFNSESEVSAGLIKDTNGTYNAENTSGIWVADGYDGGAILLNLNKSFKVNGIPEFSGLSVSFRMKTDGSTSANEWLTLGGTHDFNFAYKNGTLGIGVNYGSLEKAVGVDQNYHYYVVNYDGQNISLYKDGKVAGFGSAAKTSSVAGGFWTFGTNGSASTIVNTVKLDDLKIYDHVLSETEITYENDNGQFCYADTWSCGEYPACSADGTQTRTCSKTLECPFVETPSPSTSQSCTPPVPLCSAESWSCTDWNTCSVNGSQTRLCNKVSICEGGTPAPSISQSCTYIPPQPKVVPPPQTYQPTQPSCTADTWSCGDWNACSLSGIQNRSCRKTFDCPSVESAPPAVDQSCESPNRPIQQQPQVPQSSDEISNQDSIVRASVKLICPVDSNRASQGSGTIINSNGTILTNKHVVEGTLGCLVGFVDNFSDEPYFGERQIADILRISSGEDVATLKIRNPQNASLPYINIANGNSKNLRLGTKIITYGYPAKFGTNITYTSGDFSGTSGNYLKTTAIIEHGNSGGGAYLKDGTFIGVPSAVIKGELNALGYVLSINTINAWLDNSSIASNSRPNNDYSRVSSVLENIDLKKLDSLQLIIPNTKESTKETPQVNNGPSKISKPVIVSPTKQVQKNVSSATPKITEPKVIENKKSEQATTSEPSKKPAKTSLPKRFLFWLANLF